jgi:hypothetical protein
MKKIPNAQDGIAQLFKYLIECLRVFSLCILLKYYCRNTEKFSLMGNQLGA